MARERKLHLGRERKAAAHAIRLSSGSPKVEGSGVAIEIRETGVVPSASESVKSYEAPPCGQPGGAPQAPLALAEREIVKGTPNSNGRSGIPKLQNPVPPQPNPSTDTEPSPPSSPEDSSRIEISPMRGGPGVVNVSVSPALALASQLEGGVTPGGPAPASAPTVPELPCSDTEASASINPDVPSGFTNGIEQFDVEVMVVVPRVQVAVENETARRAHAAASIRKTNRSIGPLFKCVAKFYV
jgi:hypothetical protein